MKLWKIVALLIPATLTGCKTVSLDGAAPAVVAKHSEASLTELRQIVTEAFHNTPVLIADSALTDSSKLFIEQKKLIGPDGTPVQTRVDEKPRIFQLFKLNDKCYLKDHKTEKVYLLEHFQCREK